MPNELTPLFALEAEQLLEAGFPEEAIALCKKGLEIYPNYPTAVSLLVRALKHNGASEEAEITLENAKRHFPRNKIIDTIEKYDELAALKSDFNMIASANSGSEMYDKLKSVSLVSQQNNYDDDTDV